MRKWDGPCGPCPHIWAEVYKSTSGFYMCIQMNSVIFAMVSFVSLFKFCCLVTFFYLFFFFPPSAVVVKQLRSLSLPGSNFLWAIDTFVVWSWSIGVFQFTETCLIKPPVLLLVSLGQTSHRPYPLWQWSVTIHLNNICLTMISSWQTLTSLSVSVRCKNIRNSLS